MQPSAEVICGQTDSHLAERGEFAGRLHAEVVEPFIALRDSAAAEGFELSIASAFRSFDRQLMIWNAKVQGKRPVLDTKGEPLDVEQLSPATLMHAILRWSALPGASRHHWGTDMDVFDAAGLAGGETPQLVPAEYLDQGPSAALSTWMEEALPRFGFVRPYMTDRGGIAPEPWHISYSPVAGAMEKSLHLELLAGVLSESDLELKPVVIGSLDEIFERYIQIP